MRRVVVLEDDPHNAILFRKVLEKRGGCDVFVTEDPAELFVRVRAGGVDLVVLDVSLPNSRWEGKLVNGVEICRLLKSDPATSLIPVMLATAHAMRGDAETLLSDSGADDYVAKPIVDHGEFVERVLNLMREAA
jgi:CheY-like chemotaxis protein